MSGTGTGDAKKNVAAKNTPDPKKIPTGNQKTDPSLTKGDVAKMNNYYTENPDAAKQQRINAQCFLMENLPYFTSPKNRPKAYKGLTVFDGDPQELQQKLTLKSGLETFMEMSPHQMAMLVPYVDIYLVNHDNPELAKQNAVEGKKQNATSGTAKQVLFANWTTTESIQRIMDGSQPRGASCGLKEFSYEADGGGAGGKEVKRTRVAKLKFVAESLAALDTRGSGGKFASPLDLAMEPPFKILNIKGEKVANPDAFIIRINYGWALPQNAPLHFTLKQIDQIKNQVTSLLLHQSDTPKITLGEDGSVELECTYLASVEVAQKGDASGMDVFGPPPSQYQGTKASKEAAAAQKKRTEAKAALVKHIKHIKKIVSNPDASGQPQNDKAEAYFKKWGIAGDVDKIDLNAVKHEAMAKDFEVENNALSEVTRAGIIGVDVDDRGKGSALKAAWDSAKTGKAHAKAEAEYQALTADPRLKKWSAIMSDLAMNNSIYTMNVKKELLGLVVEQPSSAVNAVKKLDVTGAGVPVANLLKKMVVTGIGSMVGANEAAMKAVKEVSRMESEVSTTKNNGGDSAWKTPPKCANVETASAECKKEWADFRARVKKRATNILANPQNVQVESDKMKGKTGKGQATEWKNKTDALAAAKKAGASQERQKKIAEGITTGTGHLPIDPTGMYIQLHYVYLGDILSAAIQRAYANQVVRDGKRTRILLGPMDYKDFNQGGTLYSCPLADIPISLKLFQAWMLHNVIGPQKTTMGLQRFLTDIVKDLIVPALGGSPNGAVMGGCFWSADMHKVGDGAGGIQFEGFEVDGVKGGADPLGNVSRLNTKAFTPPKRSLGPDPRHYLPVKHKYVSISTNVYGVNDRTGDYKTDAKNGCYHIGFNHDKGPSMEVSFERMDQEEFSTTQNTHGKGGAAVISAGGEVSVPQKCTVKMLGNNLFDLGKDFYIDIGSIGKTQDYQIALAMGFGGYFGCTKLVGSISENGWTQTVEGYPQPGGRFFNKRNEWLGSRPGVFSGVTPNTRNKPVEKAQKAAEKAVEKVATQRKVNEIIKKY